MPAASANSALRLRSSVLLRGCLLLCLALVVGCGGGSPSASTPGASKGIGKLQGTVIWPPYQPSAPADSGKAASRQAGASASRYIAPNATRIEITVQDDYPTAGHTQKQSLARPRAEEPQKVSFTFTGLPFGNLSVSVQEFDDNASQTVAVAQATSTIPIINTTPVVLPPIAPGTTVDHVDIAIPNTTLPVNTSGVVTASARTSITNGNYLVPVPIGAITFAVPPNSVATVDANTGVVNALRYGGVDITATISIAGATIPTPTATQHIQVTINNVTISPDAVTLAVQSTIGSSQTTPYTNQQAFTATVPGDSTNASTGAPSGVTWNILDSARHSTAAGGTLSLMTPASAIYTAPNNGVQGNDVSGVYYVRATSNQDTTKFVDAKVTVLSGKVQVNVN